MTLFLPTGQPGRHCGGAAARLAGGVGGVMFDRLGPEQVRQPGQRSAGPHPCRTCASGCA